MSAQASKAARELADKILCWHWETNSVTYPPGSPNEKCLFDVIRVLEAYKPLSDVLKKADKLLTYAERASLMSPSFHRLKEALEPWKAGE